MTTPNKSQVSLQFTNVRSAWPNMKADSSAVGLDSTTITWQQIFKGSLQSPSYDSRRSHFAACGCWKQTSWQVMQRDSLCW